jgi:DUF4097 and DUF4098 domain-containing protein YvlB
MSGFLLIGLACIGGTGEASESGSKEYPAHHYTQFKIETENGEITSSTSQDSVIKVTLTRWVKGPSASAHLDDIEVTEISDTVDGILTILITMPEVSVRSYGCDAEISLPESIYVDLTTSNGNIDVDGHKTGLNLYTSNGAITTDNTAEAADLQSSNGTLTIKDHTGDLTGYTSNGDIYLENTEGDFVLETSNGSIEVDNHTGDVDAVTSDGSVAADVLMPAENGLCRFDNSNGSITVAVPDTVNATVYLKTSNGDINVDFEIGDFNPDEDIFESTMGEGDSLGTIDLQTSNGNISLKRL